MQLEGYEKSIGFRRCRNSRLSITIAQLVLDAAHSIFRIQEVASDQQRDPGPRPRNKFREKLEHPKETSPVPLRCLTQKSLQEECGIRRAALTRWSAKPEGTESMTPQRGWTLEGFITLWCCNNRYRAPCVVLSLMHRLGVPWRLGYCRSLSNYHAYVIGICGVNDV